MAVSRNAQLSMIGLVVPILVMVFTVPLYIAYLGEERYGVLTLVWLLTGYLVFFDFGMGQSVAYQVSTNAHKKSDADWEIFGTAMVIGFLTGALGAVIVYLLAGWLFAHVFQMPDLIRAEVTRVTTWVAAVVPLMVFEGIFSGILLGKEHFFLQSMCKMVAAFIKQVLPLGAFLVFGPVLDVAIPAVLIGQAISLLLFLAATFHALGRLRQPRFTRHRVRELLAYGGWTSLSAMSRQVVDNSDRIFLGWLVGASGVALFAVPSNLVQRLKLLPNALTNALFPRLAKMEGEESRLLLEKALRVHHEMMLAVCATLSLAMGPLLAVWLNPGFAERGELVGQILAIALFFSSNNAVPYVSLTASGKPREASLILFGQIVPFLVVLYFAIIWFGLIGAAVAQVARFIAVSVMLHMAAGMFRLALARSLLGSVILLLTLLPSLLAEDVLNPYVLALRACMIAAVGGWALYAAPELLGLVPARLRFWTHPRFSRTRS